MEEGIDDKRRESSKNFSQLAHSQLWIFPSVKKTWCFSHEKKVSRAAIHDEDFATDTVQNLRPRSPRFGGIASLNNASGAANVELFAGYAQRGGIAGLQIVNIDT